ncbi:MAG TPA: ATP-grasp domain-containing protein [Gammaproteobacteria bacterium]|nr:ATP-grasp domain-containing protein [Gammaproteobacteria bacterium]
MSEKKVGILLLSHCGYSFMEELSGVVRQLGWESYVLSSCPLVEPDKRIKQLSSYTDQLIITKNHVISWDEVQDTLDQLRLNNKRILACLSVWEGYRGLMARTNAKLGAFDIHTDDVCFLRDKFLLREMLKNKQLTHIDSEILCRSTLKKYKKSKKRKFIKPRYGIASYGAFSFTPTLAWQDIENIKNEIINDEEYVSIFDKKIDFIIEDYIDAPEFSFEVIIFQDIPYVIAIHEKIDLRENKSTVLEAACTSAPLNLSRDDITEASTWIHNIVDELRLSFGCYHIEARLSSHGWEIIEMNPRVGGALITKSVELLTNGESLLSLWLKTLITQDQDGVNNLHSHLKKISTRNEVFFSRKDYTFFRVYFATTKGIIQNIRINEIEKQPVSVQTFFKQGQKISNQSREIFIGQALWKISKDEVNKMTDLLHESKNLFEVIYE